MSRRIVDKQTGGGISVPQSTREESLDGLKYLLIICVVIGHFIEPSRYNNQYTCLLYSIIYSFHMPLFILLSGYFYKIRSFKDEIHKCLPLLEVCLISHIAFLLLWDGYLSVRNLVNFGYCPSWYLLSLVCWRLSSSIFLSKLSAKVTFILSIALEILFFLAIPRYGGLFSIMRTIQFYPFFVLGYVMKGRIKLLCTHKLITIVLGLLAIIYAIYTSSRLQHQVFFQRSGLIELSQSTDMSIMGLFLFRYSLIISSVLVCLMILSLLYQSKIIESFAAFGRGTLFVYFGQTLIYPFAVYYCSSLTLSLIASFLAVVLLTYLSFKPISKWLMNPVLSLLCR